MQNLCQSNSTTTLLYISVLEPCGLLLNFRAAHFLASIFPATIRATTIPSLYTLICHPQREGDKLHDGCLSMGKCLNVKGNNWILMAEDNLWAVQELVGPTATRICMLCSSLLLRLAGCKWDKKDSETSPTIPAPSLMLQITVSMQRNVDKN